MTKSTKRWLKYGVLPCFAIAICAQMNDPEFQAQLAKEEQEREIARQNREAKRSLEAALEARAEQKKHQAKVAAAKARIQAIKDRRASFERGQKSLRVGMSYDQVERLIGNPDSYINSTTGRRAYSRWRYDRPEYGIYVFVSFSNGKVHSVSRHYR